MRAKIIIGLSMFALILSLSCIYIISTIEKTTYGLERLILLHQVEILREHLLIQIKRVQSDLSLRNTRFAKGFNAMIKDVTTMRNTANTCFLCHHETDVEKRLNDLNSQIHSYQNALSRLSTIRANADRLTMEEDNTFKIGSDLITTVNDMIAMAGSKLEEKTQAALAKIRYTKIVLYVLIGVGPLISAVLAIVFIKGISKPISELLNATRKLKDGNLNYHIRPLKDEFGELAVSFNEMSGSLKEYLSKIEESEKRYRTLFENAEEAIFILEAEGEKAGKIVAANRAAAEMHGYIIDELLTMNIKDLDTPETAREVPDNIKRILNGERIKAEIAHLKKDGTVFPVEISAGLLELSGHKYILAFDRDITERKKAEEQLLRTEQMVICGEVTTGLAHEIKNPLAGIKASIELFSLISALPEEEKNVLKKIIGEIKRIESLLKGILNFAKPPKPDFISVNVNNILETALTFSLTPSSSQQDPKGKIQIVKDLDGHLPDIIADPMQLSQIFLNLLLNANEAMKDGGILTIKTSYNPVENSIFVRISDTGTGIEKKLQEQMFHPFFTTKSKGTGLGLSITRRLTEQHNGLLTFENNPAGGATFTIKLPVEQNHMVRSV
jgi:two-component system sensor histidine kinase AtoS